MFSVLLSGSKKDMKNRPFKEDRFCNMIAKVALTDTSRQNNLRLERKEVLSTSKSKQTRPQKLFQTSRANSRLVEGKGCF